MKQTTFDDLSWLTDKNWTPKVVRKAPNSDKKEDFQKFDDELAKSYGYESNEHMITHNNQKHKRKKLRFGDMYLRGDLV